MVKLFFGLPGCGKTTILASLAYREAHRKHKRYENIYSNIHLNIDGVTFIDNDCIGKYLLRDCLILIDEATLFADSRDFKSFGKDRIEYFNLHRHYNADIIIFNQMWDGVDRKIRCITDRVYYVFKTPIFGLLWTSYYRIPYGIIIPDAKSGSAKLGEIVQGYCKPSFFERLFAHKVFRPKYYKYFDSWSLPRELPSLPSQYKPFKSIPQVRKLHKHRSVQSDEVSAS